MTGRANPRSRRERPLEEALRAFAGRQPLQDLQDDHDLEQAKHAVN